MKVDSDVLWVGHLGVSLPGGRYNTRVSPTRESLGVWRPLRFHPIKGGPVGDLEAALEALSSKPHGHVLAVPWFVRHPGLDQVLSTGPRLGRDRVVATEVHP